MGMKNSRKNHTKNAIIAMLLAGFVMSGCASASSNEAPADSSDINETVPDTFTESAKASNEASSTDSTSEDTSKDSDETTDTVSNDAASTDDEESTDLAQNSFDDLSADENASSSESGTDSATDASKALFQSYLDNKVKVDGTYFHDKYEDIFNDFGEIQAYYYDMDDDGQDELLINMLYYGFDIYDIKDGEIYFLTGGEGTTGVCTLYEIAGNVYVGHSDFTHAGRRYLQLTRYDGSGEVVDDFNISADFSDSESDMYDENSTFTCNGESLTMEEYEKYMESYHYIDPEEMEKAEFAPF